MELETPPQESKKLTPKANMLKEGTVYSFTLNPDTTRQYCHTRDDSHRDRIRKVLKYFSKLFQRCNWEYVLYPEISTPSDSTKLPRIHFHGFVCFRDLSQIIAWYSYISVDLEKCAYYNIDTWDKSEVYTLYAKKNETLMNRICEHYKVDYPLKSLRINKLIVKYTEHPQEEP